jgi:translation initiation factor 2-alpha kinase 1
MINNELLAVASITNNDTASKRHQTKLLLVSLIESLCQTYGDSTDATRQIFFMICQTLSTLGFIDAEFIDEVASIRSTYHRAFEQLFYTAAQTVRKQQKEEPNTAKEPSQPRLLTASEHDEEEDISPLKYTLSIQNSRYHNDFVEQGILGRGGFASAWRARNKLDDIDYAIKKIRLLGDEEGYYDKIFREIKNLARLEHHNVVRYYSSWLEYATVVDHPQASDEEKDISWLSRSSRSQEESHDSIFQGRDPTFEQDHATSEEMSFICFGSEDQSDDSEPLQPSNQYLCHSTSNSTVRKSNPRKKKTKEDKGGFILFIQMQLCPSTHLIHLVITKTNFDTLRHIARIYQV